MADFRSLMPWGRTSMQRGGFDPLSGFRQEMDRLLEDFGRSWPAGGTREGGVGNFLVPKVDVCETEQGLELNAELPGFDEQDVQIDIQDNVLTIRAEHEEQREEKGEKRQYHLVERSQGRFLRRFALPFEADADQADARLEKGVLTVTVPRMASPEKQARRIPLGAQGERGRQGEREQLRQSEQGRKGEQGEQGEQGWQGEPVPQGEQGEQGRQGEHGAH